MAVWHLCYFSTINFQCSQPLLSLLPTYLSDQWMCLKQLNPSPKTPLWRRPCRCWWCQGYCLCNDTSCFYSSWGCFSFSFSSFFLLLPIWCNISSFSLACSNRNLPNIPSSSSWYDYCSFPAVCPTWRWENMVKEYVSERGVRGNVLEWARRECMDRERWRSICHSHPPLGMLLEGTRHQSYWLIDWLCPTCYKLGHQSTKLFKTSSPAPHRLHCVHLCVCFSH